ARLAELRTDMAGRVEDLALRERAVADAVERWDSRVLLHYLPEELGEARADFENRVRMAHAGLSGEFRRAEADGETGPGTQGGVGGRVFERRWNEYVERLTSGDVVAGRVEYLRERPARMQQARGLMAEVLERFEGDLSRGGDLGTEGRRRVMEAWEEEMRRAMDEDPPQSAVAGDAGVRRLPRAEWEEGPRAGDSGGRAGALARWLADRPLAQGDGAQGEGHQLSWERLPAGAAADALRRPAYELALQQELDRAATDFTALAQRSGAPDIDTGTLQRIGEDYRDQTLATYQRLFHPADDHPHDITAWLTDERTHENAFATALTTARTTPAPDRSSPAPTRPRTESETAPTLAARPGTTDTASPHTDTDQTQLHRPPTETPDIPLLPGLHQGADNNGTGTKTSDESNAGDTDTLHSDVSDTTILLDDEDSKSLRSKWDETEEQKTTSDAAWPTSYPSSGGLPGGSRDAGLDPMITGWDVGGVFTASGPRTSGERLHTVAVEGVPALSGSGKQPERWQTLVRQRPLADPPDSFSYQVSTVGRIQLPDGQVLPAGPWFAYGRDFVLLHSDVYLLRGDSAWIGRPDNADQLRDHLTEASTAFYELSFAPAGLYLTSYSVVTGERNSEAAHIPATLTSEPPTDNTTPAEDDQFRSGPSGSLPLDAADGSVTRFEKLPEADELLEVVGQEEVVELAEVVEPTAHEEQVERQDGSDRHEDRTQTTSPDGASGTADPVPRPALPDAVTRLTLEDRAGELGLTHFSPIPDAPFAALRGAVHQALEDVADAHRGPLDTMRAWAGGTDVGRAAWLTALTPTALESRLRAALGPAGALFPLPDGDPGSGLVLGVRLRLTDPRPATPRLADRPGGVQRWGLASATTGVSTGNSDVRTGSFSLSHLAQVPASTALPSVSVGPQLSATVNQWATSASTGVTVRSLNLQGAQAEPTVQYAYTAVLEYRFSASVRQADGQATAWHTVDGEGATWQQTASFPAHLLHDPGTGDEPEKQLKPVPWQVVEESVPLYGIESFPHHEALFDDVLAAYPNLAGLDERSMQALRAYLSENGLRGGFVRPGTPPLYDRNGAVVGYVSVNFALHWADDRGYRGETTNTALEAGDIIRITSAATGASLTNGVSLGGSLGLGWLGGAVNVSGSLGGQYRESHGLSTSHGVLQSFALRSAAPHVLQAAQLRPRVRLVRPDGAPLPPLHGRLAGGDHTYPVTLRVPSSTSVRSPGDPERPERTVPPRDVRELAPGMSSTPVTMSGGEEVFRQLERLLRQRGYLPDEAETPVGNSDARHHLLNNQRLLLETQEPWGRRNLLIAPLDLVFVKLDGTGLSRLVVRLGVEPDTASGTPTTGEYVLYAPGLRILNFTASYGEAAYTRTRTEQAFNASLSLSGGGPVSETVGLSASLGGAGSTQGSRTDARPVALGEEDYYVSPVEGGVHITRHAGVLRATLSDERIEELVGRVEARFATPDYRMRADADPRDVTPAPVIREVTEQDTRNLADRASGAAPHLFPRGAFLERLTLDGAVEAAVLRAVAEPAAPGHQDQQGHQGRPDAELEDEARMPGAFPLAVLADGEAGETEGTEETEETEETGDGGARTGGPAADDIPAAEDHLPRAEADAPERYPDGPSLAARLTQRLRTDAFGERRQDGASVFRLLARAALSRSHLMDQFSAMVRDPMGTLILVGDVPVRLRAYLQDVRRSPDTTDGVVTERWHVAGDGADVTSSGGSGRTVSFSPIPAVALGTDPSTSMSVGFGTGSGSATGTTHSDRTTSYRITTEGEMPAPVHHYRAGLVVVIDVLPDRPGLWGAGWRTVRPGGGTRTIAVEAAESVDFFVREADLREEAGLAALVAGAGPAPDSTAGSTAGPEAGSSAGPVAGPAPAHSLPASFVASGDLGPASVTQVTAEPAEGHPFQVAKALLNRVAPGILTPGIGYVPQAEVAVQRMTSERGLAQAVAMRQVSVSFAHTSLLGTRLVTLSLRADPAHRFEDVAARKAPPGGGLETQLVWSTGAGSFLARPDAAADSTSTSSNNSVTASLSIAGLIGLSAGEGDQHRIARNRAHNQDHRVWLHPGDSIAEADVPFVLRFDAESTALATAASLLAHVPETLLRPVLPAFAADLVARSAARLAHMWGVHELVRSSLRASAEAQVTARVRFIADTATVRWPDPLVRPAVTEQDPARGAWTPTDGTAVDSQPPLNTRWRPAGVLEVHHFDAFPQLADALRAVTPGLAAQRDPIAPPPSTQGMLIRLRELVDDRKAPPQTLGAANIAPFVGGHGADGTTIQVQLYDAVTVASTVFSADSADVTTLSASSGVSTTKAPSLGASLGQGFSLGLSAGNRPQYGRSAGAALQERRYRRSGTTQASPDGTGATGYQVAAVARITVTGPGGAQRHVVGNIHLRALERPPSEALNAAEFTAATDDAVRAALLPDAAADESGPAEGGAGVQDDVAVLDAGAVAALFDGAGEPLMEPLFPPVIQTDQNAPEALATDAADGTDGADSLTAAQQHVLEVLRASDGPVPLPDSPRSVGDVDASAGRLGGDSVRTAERSDGRGDETRQEVDAILRAVSGGLVQPGTNHRRGAVALELGSSGPEPARAVAPASVTPVQVGTAAGTGRRGAHAALPGDGGPTQNDPAAAHAVADAPVAGPSRLSGRDVNDRDSGDASRLTWQDVFRVLTTSPQAETPSRPRLEAPGIVERTAALRRMQSRWHRITEDRAVQADDAGTDPASSFEQALVSAHHLLGRYQNTPMSLEHSLLDAIPSLTDEASYEIRHVFIVADHLLEKPGDIAGAEDLARALTGRLTGPTGLKGGNPGASNSRGGDRGDQAPGPAVRQLPTHLVDAVRGWLTTYDAEYKQRSPEFQAIIRYVRGWVAKAAEDPDDIEAHKRQLGLVRLAVDAWLSGNHSNKARVKAVTVLRDSVVQLLVHVGETSSAAARNDNRATTSRGRPVDPPAAAPVQPARLVKPPRAVVSRERGAAAAPSGPPLAGERGDSKGKERERSEGASS
ncbi:hypothetical protein ABZ770_44125, partial [Streptomyces sp. NPDC006654]|uniref:hypothetical protein n=1 Tax=Streptomyces sp. NPDC006654 TaxID=3156897 RepID=UPI0033D63799